MKNKLPLTEGSLKDTKTYNLINQQKPSNPPPKPASLNPKDSCQGQCNYKILEETPPSVILECINCHKRIKIDKW